MSTNHSVEQFPTHMECETGNVWISGRLGQCLSDTELVIGILIGLAAISGWTYAHVQFYRFQRRRIKGTKRCNIRVFLSLYWFSDFLGCFGAVLAAQLPFQILFGLCAMIVHSACSLHAVLIRPLQRANRRMQALSSKRSHRVFRCILPLTSFLFPAVTMMSMTSSGSSIFKRDVIQRFLPSERYAPAMHIVGYVIGSVGGTMYCSAKIVDVFDAYMTVDCSAAVVVMYVISLCAEIFYVTSVYIHQVSTQLFLQTLPWILPRLAAAGMDIGSLIQRLRQRRNGKRRTLSEEDTGRLISSSGSELDLSDESDEVVWMPLKSVQSAAPLLPVCETAVQILSEAEGLSDKTGTSDSRRNSETMVTKPRRSRRKKTRQTKTLGSKENLLNDGSSSDIEDYVPGWSPLSLSGTDKNVATSSISKVEDERAQPTSSEKKAKQSILDDAVLNDSENVDDEIDNVTLQTIENTDQSQNNDIQNGGTALCQSHGVSDDQINETDDIDSGTTIVNECDIPVNKDETQADDEVSINATYIKAEKAKQENPPTPGTSHIGKLKLKGKTIKQRTQHDDVLSIKGTQSGAKDKLKSSSVRKTGIPSLVRTGSIELPKRSAIKDGGDGKGSVAKELQKKLDKVVKRSTSLKSLK